MAGGEAMRGALLTAAAGNATVLAILMTEALDSALCICLVVEHVFCSSLSCVQS